MSYLFIIKTRIRRQANRQKIPHTEADLDRVYSPVKGTRDGNMRSERDKRLERAEEIIGKSGEK